MHNLETINNLLNDELSAVETYQQVMNILRNDASLGEPESLMPLYKGHNEAVSSLQAHIRKFGRTPTKKSDVLGTWAQIVQECTNMEDLQAMLKILQIGEKNSIEDYEKALQNTELVLSTRCLIEWKLLFSQQSHIRTLDGLSNTAT